MNKIKMSFEVCRDRVCHRSNELVAGLHVSEDTKICAKKFVGLGDGYIES